MEKGDFIIIDYIARLKENDRVFDVTSEEIARAEGIWKKDAKYKPSTIIVGAGHVIHGLDDVLIDMEVGETRTVEIAPEAGFGKRDRRLVVIVPLREFRRHNMFPRPGVKIEINGKWATVRSVSSGRVTLDFNHPLAGKFLGYEVKVNEKIEDTSKKVEALFEILGLVFPFTYENNILSVSLRDVKHGSEDALKKLLEEEIKKYIPEISQITFE
jgi:FKBP-type peptidyl-prolyl cis-trans isomerase 2